MKLQYIGLLSLAAVSISPFARRVAAGDSEGRNRPITIVASPSILPEGTSCRVELNPEVKEKETVETTYEGRVSRTTGEGILLTVTEERRCVSKNNRASKVPFMNRLSRNVGIGRPAPSAERDVWIPAEKVRSVTLAQQPPAK